jgi:hypothetical protein
MNGIVSGGGRWPVAEDDPGAGSAETAEAVGAKQDAATHQSDSEPSSAGHRGWMLSHYRLIAFLVILLAAALIGWHYKSLANPGTEPARFKTQAPQYLHLYFNGFATKASFQIFLNANHTLNQQGYTDFNELVAVTATLRPPVPSPTTVIITSSIRPSSHYGIAPNYYGIATNYYVKTRSASERFAIVARLFRIRPRNSRGPVTYSTYYQYFSSIPAMFASNGSIYGHLPSATVSRVSNGNQGTTLAEFAPGTGKIVATRLNLPQAIICQSNGRVARGAGITHPANWGCFYPPINVSVTDRLQNMAPELNSDQIGYINPSTTTNNFDYVWRSTGNLEPVFKLTDPTAADSQSKAAFTSGIAFGVAGAALIAIFQELPKEFSWPRRKRRRESSPQDA